MNGLSKDDVLELIKQSDLFNTKPIAFYTIKPDFDKEYFFNVIVYKTNKDMLKAILEVEGLDFSDCQALQISYKDLDNKFFLGNIFFSKEHLFVEYIMHELQHAALYAAKRMKIGKYWKRCKKELQASAAEERLCNILGTLSHELYDGLIKFNLKKP